MVARTLPPREAANRPPARGRAIPWLAHSYEIVVRISGVAKLHIQTEGALSPPSRSLSSIRYKLLVRSDRLKIHRVSTNSRVNASDTAPNSLIASDSEAC